jgi:hypothetical protein
LLATSGVSGKGKKGKKSSRIPAPKHRAALDMINRYRSLIIARPIEKFMTV